MKFIRALCTFLLIAATAGCAGMTTQQQRILSGSAIGTAAGVGAAAIVGGSLVTGALVGAAAGAIGGVVVDEVERARH